MSNTIVDQIGKQRPAPIHTVEQDCNRVLDAAIAMLDKEKQRAWQPNVYERGQIFVRHIAEFEQALEDEGNIAHQEGYERLKQGLAEAKNRFEACGIDGEFETYKEECIRLIRQYEHTFKPDAPNLCHPFNLILPTLIPSIPEEYVTMDIKLPPDISSIRSVCLEIFLNMALGSWKNASNANEDENRHSCYLPQFSAAYPVVSGQAGDSMMVICNNPLVVDDLRAVKQALPAVLANFRQDWEPRKNMLYRWMEKEFFSAHALEEGYDPKAAHAFDITHAASFQFALIALEQDLLERRLLHRKSVGQDVSNKITVTGKQAIEEILGRQMEVPGIVRGHDR